MAKLPVLTANEVIRGLKKAGFIFDRQAKGSHEIWYIVENQLDETMRQIGSRQNSV